MTLKQAQKKFPLTDNELKYLHEAAQDVWNYIAGDCLDASEGKDMRRSHVLEVVCDAGRLEEKLRENIQHSREWHKKNEKDFVEPVGLLALYPDCMGKVAGIPPYDKDRYPAILEYLKLSFVHQWYGY